jgi:hypothetical protein
MCVVHGVEKETKQKPTILVQALGCTDAVLGTYGPMVGDGYFLILAPLAVGDHFIHESGVLHLNPSDPSMDILVEVSWHINVVPHPPRPEDQDNDENEHGNE